MRFGSITKHIKQSKLSPLGIRRLPALFTTLVIVIQSLIIIYLYKRLWIAERFDELSLSGDASEDDTYSRLIIVVTPTYRRATRLADMTRLAQTMMHVKNMIWIVIEDSTVTSKPVKQILKRSNIKCYYLAVARQRNFPLRGWTGRNEAIKFIIQRFASLGSKAVVYFADDDNTYDVRLFNKYIRKVTRMGVWAVGLVAKNMVEAPRTENNVVVGWHSVYSPNRTWGIDMAGFAINMQLFLDNKRAGLDDCKYKSPEPCLIESLNLTRSDATPFGTDDPYKEVLVWHTKTSASVRVGTAFGYVAEEPTSQEIHIARNSTKNSLSILANSTLSRKQS